MTPDLTKPMRWKSDHTPVIVLWSDDNDTFAEWQPPDDEPVRQHMRTEWFSERAQNIPPEPPKPKPEPTDEELDALLNQLASAHGKSYPRRITRDWFADVTARIEREKGK